MSKIEVKLDKKAKNIVSKTADIGGDTPTPTPSKTEENFIIDLESSTDYLMNININKLEEFLLSKGIDLDAEGEPRIGLGFEKAIDGSMRFYYDEPVDEIYPLSISYTYGSNRSSVYVNYFGELVTFDFESYMDNISISELLGRLKTEEDISASVYFNPYSHLIIPFLYVSTGGSGSYNLYTITKEEFDSIVTITPEN